MLDHTKGHLQYVRVKSWGSLLVSQAKRSLVV